MAHHGIDEAGATMEETHWHYSQKDHEDWAEDVPLPWAQEEELVSGVLIRATAAPRLALVASSLPSLQSLGFASTFLH